MDPDHVRQCKGHLSLLYPQFSVDDIEVTVASRESMRDSNSGPYKHKSWYVAIWVKKPVNGQPSVRLLELGPERARPEVALTSYIELRLGPKISALVVEHLRSTPMTKWGASLSVGYIATWPREEAARETTTELEIGPALPPPPTYNEARRSRSPMNEVGLAGYTDGASTS